MKFLPSKERHLRRPLETARLLNITPEQDREGFDVKEILEERLGQIQEHIKYLLDSYAEWQQSGGDGSAPEFWTDEVEGLVIPLAILFPERKKEFRLDAFWPMYKEIFDTYKGPCEQFTHAAALLILIAPERRAELDLSEQVFLDTKGGIEDGFEDSFLSYHLREAAMLAVAYPEYTREFFNNKEMWDSQHELLSSEYSNEDYEAYFRRGMFLKLFFPQRMRDVKVDTAMWPDLLRKKWGGKHIDQFLEYAMEMAIMSAENAQVNTRGEIIFSSPPRISTLQSVPRRPRI